MRSFSTNSTWQYVEIETVEFSDTFVWKDNAAQHPKSFDMRSGGSPAYGPHEDVTTVNLRIYRDAAFWQVADDLYADSVGCTLVWRDSSNREARYAILDTAKTEYNSQNSYDKFSFTVEAEKALGHDQTWEHLADPFTIEIEFPSGLDELDKGQFTQIDSGEYVLSAQTVDGTFWFPRLELKQNADGKLTNGRYEDHTWPPDLDYNPGTYPQMRAPAVVPGSIPGGLHFIVRALPTGDICCDVTLASAEGPSHRIYTGKLQDVPDDKTVQTSGKTHRVTLNPNAWGDADDEHLIGQSILTHGNYYQLSLPPYLLDTW